MSGLDGWSDGVRVWRWWEVIHMLPHCGYDLWRRWECARVILSSAVLRM